MNNEPLLTLAFLESQPRSAARALAEVDREDAAAFLATIPGRLAAPVVGHVAPWMAAEIVARLPPESAAGLVRSMSNQDAASVLRLLAKDELAKVLDQLPKGMGRSFRRSLEYPSGTVGAWMDHAVITFKAGNTVGDGLKFARQRHRQVGSHLFVVDDAHALQGAVRVADLLAARATTPLGEIMKRSVPSLSNRSLIRSVELVAEWDEYLMLPVVGRKGNVIGGLTRTGLRKGLAADQATTTALVSSSLWTHLFGSFLMVSAGLIRVIVDPVEPDR